MTAASNCAVLYFTCTGSDPSNFLLVTLFFDACFPFYPHFLSVVKVSGICQHWRHIRLCRKNIINPPPIPPTPLTHVLLNVTVHQNQLCENILDEVRFAFTDDARTRRAIVVPLFVLIELRGNKSDFSPAFGLINWQGRWTKAPRIFMYAEELFQECGQGRWPLYHQIIPADNCLLLRLPGVNTAAYVCLHKECVWNHEARPRLKFPKKPHLWAQKSCCLWAHCSSSEQWSFHLLFSLSSLNQKMSPGFDKHLHLEHRNTSLFNIARTCIQITFYLSVLFLQWKKTNKEV